MEIIKKINNNVALGIKNGKECIVFGRGVGFNKTPYILVNEEIIEKIFYDIDARLLDGLTEIHVDVLDVILKIYDDAVARLKLDISLLIFIISFKSVDSSSDISIVLYCLIQL